MKKQLLLALLIVLTLTVNGQVEKSSELYKSIKEKDSLLFNIGFNTCNISVFENILSDNFEFYHDQAGITKSKLEFIVDIQNGLCKLPYKPERVLSENDMTVYPLEKDGALYGAIQNGIHSFYANDNNGNKYLTSIAKFTHLWLLENGEFRLAKVLSYDHKDF